jgi:hypothetical protein
MFASYVKELHRPYASRDVVSFLVSMTDFIHSCHFTISTSAGQVRFVMLVTYTERGVPLSCTEFEKEYPYVLTSSKSDRLVAKHLLVGHLHKV